MDFIVAFFLCVYVITVIGREKVIESKNKKRFDRAHDEKDAWIARVTDYKLEKKIRDDLSKSIDKPEKAALVAEIEKAYEEMGLKCPNIQCDYDWKLRVVMANRGKIPELDARYGIAIGRGTPEYERAQRDTVFWMDRQLKKHGVNEKLYLGNTRFGFCSQCRRIECFYKAYVWAPMIGVFPRYETAEEMKRVYDKEHSGKNRWFELEIDS